MSNRFTNSSNDIFNFIDKNRDILEKNKRIERRKGPDVLTYSIFWISLFVWFLFSITFLLIVKAKPNSNNFFSSFWHAPVRSNWDLVLVNYAFYSSIVLFLVSIFTLILWLFRNKRAKDRINYFLVISSVLSFAGIIILSMYTGGN